MTIELETAARTHDIDFPEGTEGTGGKAHSGAGFSGSPRKKAQGTGGTFTGEPPLIDLGNAVEPLAEPPESPENVELGRPMFRVYDDWRKNGDTKLRPGLWYHGLKAGRGDAPPEPFDQWVASPIHAVAKTSSTDEKDCGLLLRFMNSRNQWREWAMPLRLLAGHGDEMRGELLDHGMRIDPSGHKRLSEWLMAQYPKRDVIATSSTGWHGESLYIMPHRVIGDGDVVFQSESAGHNDFKAGGTLSGWQNNVGRLCAGNPTLIFSVCHALASTLLHRCKRQGGGVNCFGDSSIGKSSALFAAASVFGDADFVRGWNATANGLTAAANARNDACLILDEAGQADPRYVGQVVYEVLNGIGKGRANVRGGAREVKRWRVNLLGSSEKTIGAIMQLGGFSIAAGQQVRMLDVPFRRTHGAFDDLHGMSGQGLADAIKTACTKDYGHVGAAFIEQVIKDTRDYGAWLAQVMALPAFASSDPLEGRAAGTFALAGLTGELGIEWGLLPWAEGDALSAAVWGFDAWRNQRGSGQTETRQILQAVADFVAKHGDSRFSFLGDTDAAIRDRAGWWRNTDEGERIYMFTSAGLREAVKGFDFKRSLDALSGWIAEHDKDKRSKRTKVAGANQSLYAIKVGEAE